MEKTQTREGKVLDMANKKEDGLVPFGHFEILKWCNFSESSYAFALCFFFLTSKAFLTLKWCDCYPTMLKITEDSNPRILSS